eukprot:3993180-Prymnesium_polylepis.1
MVSRPTVSSATGYCCCGARISTNGGLSAGDSSGGGDPGERDRRPHAVIDAAPVAARGCACRPA